jgi:hypothetical protein
LYSQNAHYDTLIKSNALDGDLARRIEVRHRATAPSRLHAFTPSRLHAFTQDRTFTLPPLVAQAYKVVAEGSQ